jgi:hypothetical protein
VDYILSDAGATKGGNYAAEAKGGFGEVMKGTLTIESPPSVPDYMSEF